MSDLHVQSSSYNFDGAIGRFQDSKDHVDCGCFSYSFGPEVYYFTWIYYKRDAIHSPQGIVFFVRLTTLRIVWLPINAILKSSPTKKTISQNER